MVKIPRNIVFLTMEPVPDIEIPGIYNDLLRKFCKEGYNIFIVAPSQRREGKPTRVEESRGVCVLNVRTLNVQKASIVEKGLGQVLLEGQYKRAIKKYFGDILFDLILYSTPPITLMGVVKYLKKKNPKALSYLMLKDIFPQNAVDIGMMSKSGVKGFLYNYFRKQEKELYKVSDFIGCMSPANVKYVIDHNPDINPAKVELAPNSYERTEHTILTEEECRDIRLKYNLPVDRPILIYGGNLGKPQGIPFLIQCLDANANRQDCHFLVVGDGTEYPQMVAWYKAKLPKNVSLFRRLPKEDYDRLVLACNIGLIFLDYRFTIPNYPSRLLPYIIEKKPIIAATDQNCDTGSIAEANGYGYWCPSNDVKAFTRCVDKMLQSDLAQMGENGYQYYLNNYTVEHTYNAIMKHF